MRKGIRTIVCRCEEVYLDELEEAVRNGAVTSQELKMRTRAGMGTCQGRICRSILEAQIGEEQEGVLEQSSRLTIHNPVRPVYLGQLKERDSS